MPVVGIVVANEQHTCQRNKYEPQRQVDEHSAPRDVAIVEQGHHCRTENPVADEICSEIHQDGGIDIYLPHEKEKVNHVVGCENE